MGGVGEITRAETGMEVGLELDWKDEGPGRGLAGVALTAYGAGRVCFSQVVIARRRVKLLRGKYHRRRCVGAGSRAQVHMNDF